MIDHTRALDNVNGVNFLADTHRAVTNTIDSNDYTIKSQTVGTLATFGTTAMSPSNISGTDIFYYILSHPLPFANLLSFANQLNSLPR